MDTDPVDLGDLARSTSAKEAVRVRLDLFCHRAVLQFPENNFILTFARVFLRTVNTHSNSEIK